MSLVIPTAYSSFGDSTSTEGGKFSRKFVLAQLRSDADLAWVQALRSMLGTDELKYARLRDARPRLKQNRNLWRSVEKGVGQATVIVIDPGPIETDIRRHVAQEGLSARDGIDEHAIIDACATVVVAQTPVAYLPAELFRAVPWGRYLPVASLEDFAPSSIRRRIGGGLKHAMLFAARAHAVFDLQSLPSSAATTYGVFRSPLALVCLAELLATERSFDRENPKSIHVLNEAADEIACTLGEQLPLAGRISDKPVVREVDSRGIDHIQAADVAAGWARDILETNEAQSLGGMFERVWVNGVRVK